MGVGGVHHLAADFPTRHAALTLSGFHTGFNGTPGALKFGRTEL